MLFSLPWIPLFLAVYFAFYFIESHNADYLLGPLDNVPSVILPSLLMGLLQIYFQSQKFYRLFFRRNYQKLLELEKATYSRGMHRFMQFFAALILTVSVPFLFLTVHQNIKLTDTGLVDNSAFWQISGTFYRYDEIDCIVCRGSSSDSHGTPVIRLKNGTEIVSDLLSIDDARLISILSDNGVRVK